jgi:DNA/RNA endonuclease G (NUC1)
LAQATEESLSGCADQFPNSSVNNAPTHKDVEIGAAKKGNLYLCNRSGPTSFFALEYNPSRYIPDWVAYKVSDTFGTPKCASAERDEMQCYFKSDGTELGNCLKVAGTKADKANDPFHADSYLKSAKLPLLSTGAFSGTGHDRGHMAPNNALSWHMCGTYKTFSMANMAPQLAWFNRNIWRLLEENVLYWGVEDGPIYTVTGPVFGEFPSDDFEVIRNGTVKKGEFVQPNTVLAKGNSTEVKPRIIDPTGFFYVIYRPGSGNDRARAVAFLIPHTTQQYRHYASFVSTVAPVERVSGLTSGFPDELKRGRDNKFFLDKRPTGNWSVRGDCPVGHKPQAWFANLSVEERVNLCASPDFRAPAK